MNGLAYAGYRLGQNYEEVEVYLHPGTKIVVALIVLAYLVRVGTFVIPEAENAIAERRHAVTAKAVSPPVFRSKRTILSS